MSTSEQKIVFEEPFYWLRSSTDVAEKSGPYCAKCYDNEQKLVDLENPYKGCRHVCPECNSQYFANIDEDEKVFYSFCCGE